MLKKIYAFITAAALLALCACGGESGPAETVDPYEGMVEVESGFGTKMWVELYEDVPVNDIPSGAFRWDAGFIKYTGDVYETLRGIDVSEHQKEIDWAEVASVTDFAMIRAGYRGYSEGGLYEDEYFLQNITGAMENGIDVGVYFFSQAVTPDEAVEEAEYLLRLLEDYGIGAAMPVAFDWENIDHDEARTDGLDGAMLTDCAVAFCERVQQAGHKPVIYAYRNLAYFLYDLPRLTDYTLWIGALGDAPDFYYRHEIWQYSASGTVRGIDGPVDLNLYFREKQPSGGGADSAAQPETSPAPAGSAASSEPVGNDGTRAAPAGVNVSAAGADVVIEPAVEEWFVADSGEVVIYDSSNGENVSDADIPDLLIEYDA